MFSEGNLKGKDLIDGEAIPFTMFLMLLTFFLFVI